jgi:HD superfamily phosphohydrolase
VSEGVISYDRIIEMINVKNDELVVEQKGIYSIESFIIARRLMYWQVYLHKTVLCVEQLLIRAIERAKQLIAMGTSLEASPALSYFLKNSITVKDFKTNPKVLEAYSALDDIDIVSALKYWRNADDLILRTLCIAILDRKLFKIEMSNKPFAKTKVQQTITAVAKHYKIPAAEAKYLVLSDSTSNHAYNRTENQINILTADGSVKDIANASDQLAIIGVSKPVVKYYLCYPKGI